MGGRYGWGRGGCYGGDVSWVLNAFECVKTVNCMLAFQAQSSSEIARIAVITSRHRYRRATCDFPCVLCCSQYSYST